MANGTSKNVGLGKFWQDLEISEAFLISLEVSFPHGLFLLFMSLETFYQRVSDSDFLTRISASRILPFFTPTTSSVLSLFILSLFPFIQASISRTQSFTANFASSAEDDSEV